MLLDTACVQVARPQQGKSWARRCGLCGRLVWGLGLPLLWGQCSEGDAGGPPRYHDNEYESWGTYEAVAPPEIPWARFPPQMNLLVPYRTLANAAVGTRQALDGGYVLLSMLVDATDDA